MKLIFCLFTFAASMSAFADPAIVSCWDGSFAYTQATVTRLNPQSNIFKVTLESEQQDFLQNTLIVPFQVWGQGTVSFYFKESECQQDTTRPDLMSCETHNGEIEISYLESQESKRILSLGFGDLKFSTQLQSGQLVAKMSFSGSNKTYVREPSEIQLEFRLGDNGKCQAFNH
jgi:hypothetical protein